MLHELNVDDVGEFVEMASTLIEIKSRSVLPRSEEVEEPLEDPRQDLVRRLLEYKEFRDAASMLEERGRAWQERFPRLSSDLPPQKRDPAEEPIHEVELWDLVSAFGRILREQAAVSPSNILYDDTPIEVFMQRIHAQLLERGKLSMLELFQPHSHRSTLVGLFLATLELGAPSRRAFGARRTVRRNLDSARRNDGRVAEGDRHGRRGIGKKIGNR